MGAEWPVQQELKTLTINDKLDDEYLYSCYILVLMKGWVMNAFILVDSTNLNVHAPSVLQRAVLLGGFQLFSCVCKRSVFREKVASHLLRSYHV